MKLRYTAALAAPVLAALAYAPLGASAAIHHPAAAKRASTFHLVLQGDTSKCIRSGGAGAPATIDTSNCANLTLHAHGSAASYSNGSGYYLCEETNGVVSFETPSTCNNNNQRAWWNDNAANHFNNVYHSSDWMVTLTNNAGAEVLAQGLASGEWEAWAPR